MSVAAGAATALLLARASVLGVTWAFATLGAGSGPAPIGWARLGVVLAAATAFHVAVYVWNDVVDLPLDRTEPRRAASPLVRGVVTVRRALAVAWVAAGVAVALAAAGGVVGLASMVAALALLGCYDLWGKRSGFPPALDLVQGLGWAALVWAGAAVAAGATAVTAWVAGAVVTAVMLVNGVLGAGRDLANDARHGARTTALWVGATLDDRGRVRVPPALWIIALVLYASEVGLVAAGLVAGARPAEPPLVRVAMLVPGAVVGLAALVLALGRAARQTVSWVAGFVCILVVVLLPFTALPWLSGPLAVLVVVLAVAPWAGSGWLQGRVRAGISWVLGRRTRSPEVAT